MKKKFESPQFHILPHIGPLSNEELAALPDDELERYLRENGFFEPQKRYQANENYVYRQIAGEGVLVPGGHLAGNAMITLNTTCAFLWKQLCEPKTLDELIQAARAAYHDPQDDIETHIGAFIKEQLTKGYIKEV